MSKKEDLLVKRSVAEVSAAELAASGLFVERVVELTPYPWWDFMKKKVTFAVARVTQIRDDRSNTRHITAVAFNGRAWGLWCGDNFLTGRMTSTESAQRIGLATAQVPDVVQAEVQSMQAEMAGTWVNDDTCDFWKLWRANKGLCQHTEMALASMKEDDFDALELAWHEFATGKVPRRLKAVRSAVPGKTIIEKYAFKVPVLYRGPRGVGKTYEALSYFKTNDIPFVMVQGSAGVTTGDLLGYYVTSDTPGKLTWRDGELSRFFRMARKGRAGLIWDEMLRTPEHELNIILTAFNPTLDGTYVLNTGRMVGEEDGVGIPETIEIPIANACFVATTNLGSHYQVGALDKALAERFVPFHMEADEAKMLRVLKEMAVAKGFLDSMANRLLEFWGKLDTLKTEGMLEDAPTLRTLTRALREAEKETEVKDRLLDQALLWVGDDSDGVPVNDQMKLVADVAKKIFG